MRKWSVVSVFGDEAGVFGPGFFWSLIVISVWKQRSGMAGAGLMQQAGANRSNAQWLHIRHRRESSRGGA